MSVAAASRTDAGPATDGAAFRERLERAAAEVDAPDVVLAVSRAGRRTTVGGGSGPQPQGTPREQRQYELGSLSKTFTVLLLAGLARDGVLALDDPLAEHLPDLPLPHPYAREITLRHLATHTSGLPRVPRELVAGALLRPYTNGYAGYDTARLLRAFAGARTRHAPGSRWHYSNLGIALLGPVLERATGTDYGTLLRDRVLTPLGLTRTTVGPPIPGDGPAATGYRGDGRTPLPPTDMAAFTAAGGVRAVPGDLLTYAEAHLSPGGSALEAALRDVQVPQLRRGYGRRHTHTLTWYQHPAPGGPLLFHAGATFGQQTFLGYHPATGTAVAGLATRHDRRCRVVTTSYALLYELCGDPA
ncbi:CubicO group peptidase, beta-lactamase class C family [Actinacidiphila alni]|uniref:Beta-lactamase n=1 Tax=Actinacidiphila alni TaxID=380248 RepID=A0A1I2JZV6_9ACTN|nr:serine hydrolase domain-containing protein [Actinacidiphila alni]SFF58276.1 CubicO group peptidase, beta-lactamase class C family [Actinacidiphila alni]